MAKNIPSRRKIAFAAAVAIARNKHARRLAVKGARSVMSHRQSRRVVVKSAKRRASHSRPLMIAAASIGVVSAAGAAVFARAKHATEPNSDA
jgi:hypothetical protein